MVSSVPNINTQLYGFVQLFLLILIICLHKVIWYQVFRSNTYHFQICLVGCGGRIYWLRLCKGGKTPSPENECPEFDTKQSDGKVPVILKLWGMRSTPSLPSLPGPLLLGVVAPDRLLSTGLIELNSVLMLNWMVRNRIALTFNCV